MTPPPTKTLGRTTGPLVPALHEHGRPAFSHADVQKLTGLGAPSARTLMARLVRRGVAARIAPGRFVLIPYEAGLVRDHLDNPYAAAWELAGTVDAVLSHGSAMDMHGMRDADHSSITLTTSRRRRDRKVLGVHFRFPFRPTPSSFGIVPVSREAMLRAGVVHHLDAPPMMVTDLERTILEALEDPRRVGGLGALAAGVGRVRCAVDLTRLVDHALRLGCSATLQRLGFVLEQWLEAPPDTLGRVREAIGTDAVTLDVGGPRRGKRHGRWKLRLNATARELDDWAAAARGTRRPEPAPAGLHALQEVAMTSERAAASPRSQHEELVLAAIRGGARTPDAVACAVPLPLSVLSEALYELEAAGLLRAGWAGFELAG